MKKMKQILALLLVMTMVIGLLAGCAGDSTVDTQSGNVNATGDASATGDANGDASNEIPAGQQGVGATGVGNYGGHLNVRTAGRPTSVDPMKQTGAWRYMLMNAVFEPFLTRDADNNIQPCVCDYVLSDDLLDLKVWPREGYIFSSGYGQVDVQDLYDSFYRGIALSGNITKYVKPYIASAEIEMDAELGREVLHIVFSEYREKCLNYFASNQTWWPVMPSEICQQYPTTYLLEEKEYAIGTGPYVITDFEPDIQTTITKRDDYVPVDNSDKTGPAGTKYGYMDSITFWYNSNDASAAMAVLGGDYDVTEVIPSDYKALAEQQGLALTQLPSDQRTWMYFNTKGANLCAKYPSLRKAIMAAIDYDSFLDVVTDGAQIYEGNNAGVVINPLYATDAFTKQDYYGPANQELVDKYMAQAKAEGYNDDPIQVVYHNGRTDYPTLICAALDDHGINYQLTTMEKTTYDSFIADPGNNWDLLATTAVTSRTPSLMSDSLIHTNVGSAKKDQLLLEMETLNPTSDEYLAKWDELANLLADECLLVFMSSIDWWWWHPDTLHINDEGVARYFYNAYWDDPANHPKK